MTTTDFRRVLVALDLSPMDKEVLRYIAAMREIWGAERLYFVHIISDFTAPKNVDVEFHKLFSTSYPIDEKVRDKLSLDVLETCGEMRDAAWSVEVIEGKPYEKLLHWINVKEIDLLVVGRKVQSEGSGITPRRVARRSECNILFVTENAAVPHHIVVPIDFSSNSVRALQQAVRLSQLLPEVKIEALHVVESPSEKYYMRVKPTSGFFGVLLEAAQKAYDKMIIKHGLAQAGIQPVFVEDNFLSIATRISDYLETSSADLVIVGAQGHTAFEKLFFGSVTERLVEECRQKPILVMR